VSAGSPRYPGITFGPRTRISSFAPFGTIFTSTPGTGTPTFPGPSSGKCAIVAIGAVSVDPHAAVIVTARPVVRFESSCNRCHISGVSAAAA
jgi:hypothetical protein